MSCNFPLKSMLVEICGNESVLELPLLYCYYLVDLIWGEIYNFSI